MSSRHLQDMSSRRLQDVFSVTIFRLPRGLQDVFKTSCKRSSRRLQDVFKTPLQDVFKTSWKTKNCYAEDVLKTSTRHVLKTSGRRLEDQQMFVGLVMTPLSCNRSSRISRDIGDRVNRRNIKNMTSGFFFKIGIMWWLVSAKVAPLKSCTFAKRSLLNLAIDSSDNRVPYCNAGTNQPRMFNLLRGEVIYCTIFIRYLTSLLTVF